MDADVIAAALASGATAGVAGVASTAVADAYQELKRLLLRRLKGHPDAEFTLAKHAADPETWQRPLVKQISESGADTDGEIIDAATKLLHLVDKPGGATCHVTAAIFDSQGVSLGGPQHNTFYNGPGPHSHGGSHA